MGFNQPFAVDGASTPASALRTHLYQTVKGETGVLSADSLKLVGISGSPGVLGVMPGVGVVSVPERLEAYQITNLAMDGDALIEVPAAGSGGATHYVILEITDPQYHGAPEDPPLTELRLVATLAGLTKPYLYLGWFSLGSGAGFDVTTPITDRRAIAAPRTQPGMATRYPAGNYGLGTALGIPIGGSYGDWPLSGSERPTLSVPAWATHIDIVASLSGVLYIHAGSADAGAGLRTVFGGNAAQNGIMTADAGQGSGRFHYSVVGSHAIPSAQRGTDQVLELEALRSAGDGRWWADYQTSVNLSWQFSEQAV